MECFYSFDYTLYNACSIFINLFYCSFFVLLLIVSYSSFIADFLLVVSDYYYLFRLVLVLLGFFVILTLVLRLWHFFFIKNVDIIKTLFKAKLTIL